MLESARNNILNSIFSFKQRCFDVALEADDLKPIANGHLVLNYTHDGKQDCAIPCQAAEGQFLTKIKVPVNFFHRCPTSLQQSILNYFNTARDYLLRCVNPLEDAKDKTVSCRAVLSSMFTLNYDNHLVFPVILEALAEQDVELRYFFYDELVTRMEVELSNAVSTYKGHKIVPGLMVTNSETGHSSLWIEPIVIVNGSFIFASRMNAYNEYRKFRQIHKGSGLEPEDISETVRQALKAAQVGVIQYMEALDERVKPQRALDFAKTIDALPKRFVCLWEDEWQEQESIQKETVVRQILEAAADLPILNRIAIEQSVGKWYGIFEGYTKRFEKLQEQRELVSGTNVSI